MADKIYATTTWGLSGSDDGSFRTSENGTVWTVRFIPATYIGSDTKIIDIGSFGAYYYISFLTDDTSSGVLRTEDWIDFEEVVYENNRQCNFSVFANYLYISSSSLTIYSEDGENFSNTNTSILPNGFGEINGTGYWVAVDSNIIDYSTDGETFTNKFISIGGISFFDPSIQFFKNAFYILDQNSTIYVYDPVLDTLNVSLSPVMDPGQPYQSIATDSNTLAYVSFSFADNSYAFKTTTDGITWNDFNDSLLGTYAFFQVDYANQSFYLSSGRFSDFAIGYITTPDFVNFTAFKQFNTDLIIKRVNYLDVPSLEISDIFRNTINLSSILTDNLIDRDVDSSEFNNTLNISTNILSTLVSNKFVSLSSDSKIDTKTDSFSLIDDSSDEESLVILSSDVKSNISGDNI